VDWVYECYNEKEGIRIGPFTSWWPNGNKQEEGVFLNDDADGKWTEWDESGALVSAREYKQGELVKAVRYKDGAPIRP
jgi:antitoxin component YwqK of YwqJK toxin-antitoxin module